MRLVGNNCDKYVCGYGRYLCNRKMTIQPVTIYPKFVYHSLLIILIFHKPMEYKQKAAFDIWQLIFHLGSQLPLNIHRIR